MTDPVRIGTRKSPLALWQANHIKQALETTHPNLRVELVKITTKGDKMLDVALAQVGGKGLFVKEIEEALLDARIDLAVHSMKDVPTDIAPGLILGAITHREDCRDALVSRNGLTFANLPPGARIGTSSLRRQAQLLHHRPDLEMIPIRGNLNTRLKKLETENLAAVVVALAGLKRMGWEDQATEILDPSLSLPAIGQGSLGIEIREEDPRISDLIAFLDHEPSRIAVTAERSFLHRLEGGCQVPIAAMGQLENGDLIIEGRVASLDGKVMIVDRLIGPPEDAEPLGRELGDRLLAAGAAEILKEVYGKS